MPIENLFPTQIGRSKLKLAPAELKGLVQDVKRLRDFDQEGVRWSKQNYWGGYTSYGSISDLHRRSSRFDRLKRMIDREVTRYATVLDLDLTGGRLEMSSFWVNIMGEGTHHSFHLHPLSCISGTFYVQVPKGSGGFKIEDPRIQCFMAPPPRLNEAKQANKRYVEMKQQAGDLILFESWLKHEVPANCSKQDRISLSFNYDFLTATVSPS
jgi:uncharacterized protein (TIGR02466 family)